MRRSHIPIAAITLLAAGCAPPPAGGRLSIPNPTAPPVNQLALSSNACGPAALLYAFSAGNDDWQRAAQAVSGDSDRQRLAFIIRRYALQPSRHLTNHKRWSPRGGVGSADLVDMANEMAGGLFLPGLRAESLIASDPGSHQRLLQLAHRRLATSLTKGLPPILVLKRNARPAAGPAQPSWRIVEGHYVVVTSIPARIPRAAATFDITCMDPHGGKQRTGTLRVPAGAGPTLPWLEFSAPDTPVGRRLVRPNEQSLVTATSVIGRF